MIDEKESQRKFKKLAEYEYDDILKMFAIINLSLVIFQTKQKNILFDRSQKTLKSSLSELIAKGG